MHMKAMNESKIASRREVGPVLKISTVSESASICFQTIDAFAWLCLSQINFEIDCGDCLYSPMYQTAPDPSSVMPCLIQATAVKACRDTTKQGGRGGGGGGGGGASHSQCSARS